MSIQLSRRLQWIADAVPQGAAIADVGTDHALLPIYLTQRGQARVAIATDVAEGPYRAAQSNVARYGVGAVVSVRLGDGLKTIQPGEVDTVMIAGMGGGTAADILNASPDVAAQLQHIIVQPMNASRAVRTYFKDAGFGIVTESILLEDGRYYELLHASRAVASGQPYLAYADGPEAVYALEFGPYLLASEAPVVVQYFQQLIQHYRQLVDQLARSQSSSGIARREELELRIDFLQRRFSKGGESWEV